MSPGVTAIVSVTRPADPPEPPLALAELAPGWPAPPTAVIVTCVTSGGTWKCCGAPVQNKLCCIVLAAPAGAVARGFAVGLAGSPDVRLGDRRERDKLDGVDFDHAETNPVAAALLDVRPLPEAGRQGDIASHDVITQLAAELHTPNASW